MPPQRGWFGRALSNRPGVKQRSAATKTKYDDTVGQKRTAPKAIARPINHPHAASLADGVPPLGNDNRLAAGGGDLGGGRLAELGGVDGRGLGQLAVAEDLDPVVVPPLDQAAARRAASSTTAPASKQARGREVDDGEVLLELRR